jgi:hypothetical protein
LYGTDQKKDENNRYRRHTTDQQLPHRIPSYNAEAIPSTEKDTE